MTMIALALGLVLAVEGLALALAPSRLDEVVAAIARMPRETRRTIGLAMLAAGTLLVWLARGGLH
jgi:uncharacterized protein YjeT (DUF2065 family)